MFHVICQSKLSLYLISRLSFDESNSLSQELKKNVRDDYFTSFHLSIPIKLNANSSLIHIPFFQSKKGSIGIVIFDFENNE